MSTTMASLGYVESRDTSPGEVLPDESAPGKRRFYGKYRGVVRQNVDPERRGRLFVQVTDSHGLFFSSWASPCLPMAGLQMGFYVVPPINAGVWIEFEQGDPDYPIWVGCYWGSAIEPPATAQITTPAVPVTLIESQASKSAVIISDVPVPPMLGPGILLRSGPSWIHIGPAGITLNAPKLTVIAPTDFNAGALSIT